MYVDEPPTPNSPSEHRASTAQRARLLLAQGGLAAGDEPTYQREREYLVLARVVLAQDRPAQAVALLERLHAAAATQNRAGSVIETQALRALASTASGAHAQPADRPRAGGQPRYGQKHVSHLLGKLGAANAPRPSPGPAARPDPLTGRPRPGRHCRAMSRQGTFHR
jgi:MalT-like TPR region